MTGSIYSQILLYFSIAVIMFLPGWSLLLAIFGRNDERISLLERFVLSFGLGMIVTDFLAFAFSRLNIMVNAWTSIASSLIFCGACYGFYKLKRNRYFNTYQNQSSNTADSPLKNGPAPSGLSANSKNLFSFSKNQFILVLLLLFFTVFIKTAYLSGTVAPTATDMGHHTYWIKTFVENGKLPTYDGMPDFIIGEHIALGEMAMINRLSFFSAFPVIFLFLINLLSILTVFLLTLRIFENKNVAILTLLFLGVLFTVSSPQAKFVSGGVMGNIIGNYLMPMAFYFYYRAMEFWQKDPAGEDDDLIKKNSSYFLALAIFSTFGLFYTHHLTSFIFLFIFMLLVPLFLIVNLGKLKELILQTLKIVFSAPVITTLIASLVFFFFIFTPNYIETNAVQTTVGAPSKSTRTGLTLTNLKDSVGEARLALGLIGLIILAIFYKKRNFGYAIITAWTVMLLAMSSFPQLLFINLPSDRIGNYLAYPLAILSAYGLYMIFQPDTDLLKKSNLIDEPKNIVPLRLLKNAFFLIAIFVFASGLSDSADAFKKSPDFTPTLETFSASEYLKKNTAETDIILKDHNYLSGDTWMKLLLMRGYTYPLSRSYFKRYEDPTKPREMCTLYMISQPDTQDAKDCFESTETKYLIVNPRYDSSQFTKLRNFDEIYDSGNVAIYYKK